jgi:hypothetical protein
MKITKKLKDSLFSSTRLEILNSMCAIMCGCVKIFIEYGISPETLSFIDEGMRRISEEVNQAYKELKLDDDFKKIVKDLDKGEIK